MNGLRHLDDTTLARLVAHLERYDLAEGYTVHLERVASGSLNENARSPGVHRTPGASGQELQLTRRTLGTSGEKTQGPPVVEFRAPDQDGAPVTGPYEPDNTWQEPTSQGASAHCMQDPVPGVHAKDDIYGATAHGRPVSW